MPSLAQGISSPGKDSSLLLLAEQEHHTEMVKNSAKCQCGTRGTSKAEEKVGGKFTRPRAQNLLLASSGEVLLCSGTFQPGQELSHLGELVLFLSVIKVSSLLPTAHPVQSWHFQ